MNRLQSINQSKQGSYPYRKQGTGTYCLEITEVHRTHTVEYFYTLSKLGTFSTGWPNLEMLLTVLL